MFIYNYYYLLIITVFAKYEYLNKSGKESRSLEKEQKKKENNIKMKMINQNISLAILY